MISWNPPPYLRLPYGGAPAYSGDPRPASLNALTIWRDDLSGLDVRRATHFDRQRLTFSNECAFEGHTAGGKSW